MHASSNQLHQDHGDHKCGRSTFTRINRVEIIVAVMAVVLLALVADKIRSNPPNDSFVTKADLRDIEQTISSLKNDTAFVTNKNDRELAKHASLLSELNDKVVQFQQLPAHSAKSKPKTRTKRKPKPKQPEILASPTQKPSHAAILMKEPLRELHFNHHIPKLSENKFHSLQNNRKLESSIFNQSDNHHRCEELPILSPSNHLNDFTYDERVDRTLAVIRTLSSTESLNNHDSPQYKAACWILFDDILEISTTDGLFIERYVLAVLLYSTFQSEQTLLSMNTCDHEVVTCDNNGHISGIDLSETGGTESISLVGKIVPSELSHLRYLGMSMQIRSIDSLGLKSDY